MKGVWAVRLPLQASGGLGESPRLPPPTVLFTSHCQQGAFGCRGGIRGPRAHHSQIPETWVIEKISLNVPVVIWRAFELRSPPCKMLQTTKGSNKHVTAPILTYLCLLRITCQPRWQMRIHPKPPSTAFPDARHCYVL